MTEDQIAALEAERAAIRSRIAQNLNSVSYNGRTVSYGKREDDLARLSEINGLIGDDQETTLVVPVRRRITRVVTVRGF